MRINNFKGVWLILIALLIASATSSPISPASTHFNNENIARKNNCIYNMGDENARRITLITGDVVIVSDIGGGQRTFQFMPADQSSGSAFQTFKGPDGTYVFPRGVDLNKLDKELFNIDYLIEQGYHEMAYLPVIVSVTGKPNKNVGWSGIRDIERSAQTLNSIEVEVEDLEGEVTMNSPRLSILTAKLPVDTIEKSTKVLLERPDVKKIWLDKKNQVSLNESVPLIGAPELWAAGDNGAGIKIAILDTGIDATHPDLDDLDDNSETADPKVLVTANFTDDNSADDFFGHGTHCAGIAAGTGKASDYLYRGVAPGAYLWNIKVLNRYGYGYDSWIISGIQYAAFGPDDKGETGDEADVISMSFGASMNGDGTDPISTAVDWATDQGVVCVAAAGNSGPSMYTVGMPAVARKVITVGAATKADSMAEFSSRGLTADYRLKPDVVAPGVDIIAPRASGTSMGSPIDENYTRASGTSMSTPHVAGAAALILQSHSDWSPVMVKSALMGNAKVLENVHLWEQGAGRIQVPEAENAGLIAVEPSLSFGMLGFGENKVATLTLINPTDSAENVSISTYTKCDNVETDYVSENPASLSIGAQENAEVLVQVGPLDENAPEGWYEGWINITCDQENLKVPYLFAAFSIVNVKIFDLDNSEISAMVALATYPDMAFASFASETPAQLYVKSGDYAVLTQCAWIEKDGQWPPEFEWQRMFMMEKTISVPRLSEVYIEMRLAEVSVKEILTVDNVGENLIVHCYTQYFCGNPYFNEIVGVTMMKWSLGGGWFGFDVNTSSLTLYSSVYDPAENLSQSFGFYASDNLLSKVYLLNWKYRNVPSLPSTITYDYSDLAKYDFHYDMPETYPENGLNSMNAFWFTWENMGDFQGWSWDAHEVPAGSNAEYYIAPWSATYWGYYMPWYEGWERMEFGPLQDWQIGRHYPYPQIPPENGETGSLVLGDFQFAPYIPGLSLDILENGLYTIRLTGDIWENLAWPHWQWYRLSPPEGLISPYPQDQEPQYSLYVDNLLVGSGTFGRIDVDRSLGIWWDNIENSWDVTGENARLEIHMPSLATISKWTTYELSFTLADNVFIPPIFDNISMPLSYSPGENIIIQLVTPENIAGVTLEYSFDNGASWETAQENQGYLIPCEAADWLAVRIDATDGYGNSLRHLSNPVALCREVILDVPARVYARPGEAIELSGRLTTIEGRGLEGIAVDLSDGENVRYAPSDENGAFTFTFAVPSAEGNYDLTLTSVAAGVYDNSQVQVLLTVDGTPPAAPALLSPANGATVSTGTPTFDWSDVTDPSSPVTYVLEIVGRLINTGLTTSTYTLTSGEALPNGTYSWRVRAADNAGIESDWSETWSFTVTTAPPPPPPPPGDNTPPPTPLLVSPTNGTITNDNTQTFKWSAVSDPSGVTYTLQVDNDSDFTSPEINPSDLIDNAYTPSYLAEENYSWRVRAVDGAGNLGDWSTVWTLLIDTTAPAAPDLLGPADGALTNDNTPTFRWTAEMDPSGVTYTIQVDNDADFTSPEVDFSGITENTYTPFALADENYSWHVRAVDGAGNASSWSENWSFTVSAASSIPPPQSLEIPIITTEAPARVEVENAAITALEISVLRTVEDVRITIRELVDRPAEIAIAAPGVIYRYLEIIKENIADDDISSVTITFKVEKAWIAAQGVDENTITLKRYNAENGEWVSLPTVKVDEDATYIYFSVTSPRLSYFAISGIVNSPAPSAFTVTMIVLFAVAIVAALHFTCGRNKRSRNLSSLEKYYKKLTSSA